MNKSYVRVCLPVADLRKEPVDSSCGYERDPLQETQVLYNEMLEFVDESDEWYFVEAAEQIRINEYGETRGYPGWIRKSAVIPTRTAPDYNAVVRQVCATVASEPSHDRSALVKLPLGVRLVIEENMAAGDWMKIRLTENVRAWVPSAHINTLPVVGSEERLRENLTRTAKLFIGMPYLWGGRSTCAEPGTRQKVQGTRENGKDNLLPFTFNLHPGATGGIVRGVDCSGFTNLVYRANLIDIPRDAADQARACLSVSTSTLRQADLIFVSAQGCRNQIVHVMFSLGGEEFIEAVETGSFVRRCTFKEKYGLTTRELKEKQWNVNGREISFGSILGRQT